MSWTRGKKSAWVGVVCGVLAAAGLAGCGGAESNEPDAAGDSIVIGAALALSGPFVSYDEPPLKALELFVKRANADGGVDGRTIELKTADTKSDPAQGPIAAQQLLGEGVDVMVVSCDFDMGSPAANVAIENELITFSTCAGTSLFGPKALGQLAFTAGTPTEIEAAAMAEWAYDSKDLRNAALLVDGSIAFNKVYAEAFKQVWTEKGGTIATEQNFKAGDPSVADQVARIASADGVDTVVAVTNLPAGPAVIQQLRAGGVDVPVLAHSGMAGEDWLKSVPALGDFYFTDVMALGDKDPRPEVAEVTTAYEQEFGPAPAGFTFTGYILGQIIAAAIEGTDGDLEGSALASWLEENPVTTIVGESQFNTEDHVDRGRSQVIFQHTDNGVAVQEVVTPTSVPRTAN